jgi:hypothetical protein
MRGSSVEGAGSSVVRAFPGPVQPASDVAEFAAATLPGWPLAWAAAAAAAGLALRPPHPAGRQHRDAVPVTPGHARGGADGG